MGGGEFAATQFLAEVDGHPDDPVSVFIGALGALLVVSGLAAIAGRALLRFISLHALHYLGAAVCLLLAGLTAYELLA